MELKISRLSLAALSAAQQNSKVPHAGNYLHHNGISVNRVKFSHYDAIITRWHGNALVMD